MAKYKLKEHGVQDVENHRSIPCSMDNRHWREYQEWLADGNTPDPEFNQTELDAKAEQEVHAADEEKIKLEMRNVAIQNLKFRGELPADFSDPQIKVVEK